MLHLGKFYPPDNGGIESVTASLARASASAGFDVRVLCFEEIGKGCTRDGAVVVTRFPAIKLASQPLSLAYIREARKLSRQSDIVHAHLPNMLAAWVVGRLSGGPKVILHWHSDVIGKGLLSTLTQPIEHRMLRRADAIICTSQAYADHSAKLKPFLGKVRVVPIGVPDVQSPPEGLDSHLPPPLQQHLAGRPLILAVGRLVPYKGFGVLIDAASRLSTDAAVVIVGGGPLARELRRQVGHKDAAHRVYLAGRVSDLTLSALQHRATLLCMPSLERSEAFGVALVEAFALGLPAVATTLEGSGVPWVNLHEVSGLNAAPGDPAALAAALDRILQDSALCQRLGRGARKRYEALFTERRSMDGMLAIYNKLLNR